VKIVSFAPAPGKQRPLLKIIEAKKPIPKRGEVLIRVSHAGLNNGDFEIFTGRQNKAVAKRLKTNPVVTGIEMAGTVESGGKHLSKGDLVVGYTNIFKGPWFHGEYICLPETKLVKVPEGWDAPGAAAIIGGAVTAIAALERIAKIKPSDKVLITGASGSVGTSAVQLARHLGAEVDATCHSSQVQFVGGEGASNVYAYDAAGPSADVRSNRRKYTCVFDTAPSLSFASAKRLLKPGGVYITTMPHLDMSGFLRSLVSQRRWGFLLEFDTDQKRLARLAQLMEANVLRPVIDSVYSVDDAASAFARQEERGKRGKILIDFSRH